MRLLDYLSFMIALSISVLFQCHVHLLIFHVTVGKGGGYTFDEEKSFLEEMYSLTPIIRHLDYMTHFLLNKFSSVNSHRYYDYDAHNTTFLRPNSSYYKGD